MRWPLFSMSPTGQTGASGLLLKVMCSSWAPGQFCVRTEVCQGKVAFASPHGGSRSFNSIIFPVSFRNLVKCLPVDESQSLSSEAGLEVGCICSIRMRVWEGWECPPLPSHLANEGVMGRTGQRFCFASPRCSLPLCTCSWLKHTPLVYW